ncbi:ADOP family duplicated permease [Acidicapsa dinghuensis]|uniref:ADOP family duplicated permease n=1 Tax=Acidicapsa dinghuensis TaxID=2218256 RepID=A0ABW1ECM5_9BACT|nr:ABC transporter permease [Acidicapsa dinghuensis]
MHDWSKEIEKAITPLNLSAAREAEVVEELGQHLSDRYEDLLISGVSEEQARQILKQDLTDGKLVAGLKATLRETSVPIPIGREKQERLLAGIWNDLQYGARLLSRSPGFAIVAILSLALGIGANTTIFQLLDAVRLRMLPVKKPEQLARVAIVNSPHCCSGDFYSSNSDLTGDLWKSVHDRQQGFSAIAAWADTRINVGAGGEAHYANALLVSGDFFHVLEIQPFAGRLISPADDYRGCGVQGAVLSYPFWQREFGGRPGVVGGKLLLNGHPFQIIGITPASFYGLEVGQNFDAALPLCSEPVFSTNPNRPSLMDSPAVWWLAAIGRLKPGWTLERASSQLDAISPGIFAATLPAGYDAAAKKDYLTFHLGALPSATGVSALRKDYDSPLWILLAMSGLVLLIACANLANLMLARASARQREMALRLTLGASRKRLIRQLLAESLLLATLGMLAGVGLAQIMSRALVAFLSTQQNPVFVELTPDWRVLGFVAGLAILTCILFGLAPAIQASQTEPGVALKAGARGTTAGRNHFLLRRIFVISQVALSLVLLTAALLFVRSFRNIVTLNAGFQQDHILIADFEFAALMLPPKNQMIFKQALLSRIEAIPGINSAAEVQMIPMSQSGWDSNIDIPGGAEQQDVTLNRISPGYFQTMETPLLAGRDFDHTDLPAAPRKAIVNQAFARKFYGGANPVGKVFHDSDAPAKPYEIVGMVKDSKFHDMREDPPPTVYVSFTQSNGPEQRSTLVIRSEESLDSLIPSINRAANQINPSMEIGYTVLKTQIREGLLRERLMATLSGFFGALATILAVIGIYGVISYVVLQRRNEIGVRMALGADRTRIVRMVLGDAAILISIGVLTGTAMTIASGNAAAAMLYGLKPRDPGTLAAAIAGIAVVGVAASFMPALRAANIHPVAALREE